MSTKTKSKITTTDDKPEIKRHAPPPLPPDCPLLSWEETAAMLRMTVDALRAALKGQHATDAEFTTFLKSAHRRFSERRSYFNRAMILDFVAKLAAPPSPPSP